MTIARHRDFRLQRLRIGREQAPLVVIDNLVTDPDDLVNVAASKQFGEVASYYPGIRAKAAADLSAIHSRQASRRDR